MPLSSPSIPFFVVCDYPFNASVLSFFSHDLFLGTLPKERHLHKGPSVQVTVPGISESIPLILHLAQNCDPLMYMYLLAPAHVLYIKALPRIQLEPCPDDNTLKKHR